jgi:IclR family KDG regulon transcriptional repressor
VNQYSEQWFRISEWWCCVKSRNTTVVKSMSLLNLFLKHEKLSLNQMVQLMESPKTSVYRMACSLEQMGFLTRDAEGKYSLGLLFLQFGQLVKERLSVRNVALPIMQQLRDEVQEAINLIIPDQFEAVYVEKVDTNHPVRIYNERPGRRVPMYAGACPRILLSYLPEHEQEEYFRTVLLQPIARGTITDIDVLRRVVRQGKADGYTISHSELLDDTSAVAAPVFDHVGDIVAGISVAGPTSRFGEDAIPFLIERVTAAARACSALLGYEGSRQTAR